MNMYAVKNIFGALCFYVHLSLAGIADAEQSNLDESIYEKYAVMYVHKLYGDVVAVDDHQALKVVSHEVYKTVLHYWVYTEKFNDEKNKAFENALGMVLAEIHETKAFKDYIKRPNRFFVGEQKSFQASAVVAERNGAVVRFSINTVNEFEQLNDRLMNYIDGLIASYNERLRDEQNRLGIERKE